jgi:hypothetical protein
MLELALIDPELEAEEAWKETEAYSWEALSEKLSSLIDFVSEKRDRYEYARQQTRTPEYEEVEYRLTELKEYVDGRAQELNPYYAETRYEYRSARRKERELLEYAKQEGINWYALECVYGFERKKAVIEYLMERGLASMKYTIALKEVKEAMKVCR